MPLSTTQQRNGYIGRSPSDSAVTKAIQVYDITSDTSSFTFTAGYDIGYFDVFINGVKLLKDTDYTANDGSTFTLTTTSKSGDTIEAIAYKAFNIGNINASTGNFLVTYDLTVSGDAYIGSDNSAGVILTSPNGTQYRLVVANDGTLSTSVA